MVDVKAGSLVGSHVGEGIQVAQDKVREALGGILFIDEVYGLTQGSLGASYGADVINNVLVPAMTDHKDNLVVIVAGYTRDVDEFLKTNAGLSSRFVYRIDFPDLDCGNDSCAVLYLEHYSLVVWNNYAHLTFNF